jgi:diaminohydroxyphosphoribosylaminopyrimidine deaminase/5-amino-6-(5-phosphoribosylamino)uracil reductase
MVGIGTVMQDNPQLNVRMIPEARQPVRMIVDSKASIPLDSRICQTANEQATIIAHTDAADTEKIEALHQSGVETLLCERQGEHLDLKDLMRKLGAKGIDAILLEGGGELNFSFLQQHLVDEVYAFIAPKYIGGRNAKTPVEGSGWERMADAVQLKELSVEQVGNDVLIHGFF